MLISAYLFFLLGGAMMIHAHRLHLKIVREKSKMERANATRAKLILASQRWRR